MGSVRMIAYRRCHPQTSGLSFGAEFLLHYFCSGANIRIVGSVYAVCIESLH